MIDILTHKLSIWKLSIIVCIFALPVAAAAEGTSERTLAPYFFIQNGDASIDHFPVKETRVKVSISGVIADVSVMQRYKNEGQRPINGRYVFPASTRAAVHGMTMTVGDSVITADIQEKKQADKTFQKAKKAGKSASLLTQHRPNVFSMSVANILPGDAIDIELHYSEFLVPTDGTYAFIFPTVAGPRYSEVIASEAAQDDRWVQSPYLPEGEKSKMRFDLTAQIATGIPLQDIRCTTHKTDIQWENAAMATVALRPSEADGADRDFILEYRLAGEKIESGVLLYESEDENFFAVMVQPPERIAPESIPDRDYVFVVDVSGSMNGFPLNTAKTLLENLIGNLRPTDTFNVVLFAGGANTMADASVGAGPQNIRRAVALINTQRGGGGTRLASALKKAMALPKDEARSRSIVIVTDGYIAAEREVFELIEANLNAANVFSFGIGSSVNRYLIEGMARAGRGEPFVVTDPARAPLAAERFRQYIASPLLTRISVGYDGFGAYDVEPRSIPDLFAGRPIVVFGKWRGSNGGTIRVSGISGGGRYTQTFNIAETDPTAVNSPLQYLWARSRVARLSDYNVNRGNAENKREITSLGLTYSLLTPYTSFVAVHDIIRNPDGAAEDVAQPLPLPKGVSHLAVGGAMVRVPEPGLVELLGAAALLFMAGMLARWIRRRGSGGGR